MDLLDRYVAAIARHLPVGKADDIVAELRDVLLCRIEDQETALGRPLQSKEIEATIKAFGRPLEVASRYRPARYLIGPEIFPYWWASLKAVLLIVSAVLVSLLLADVVFARGPSGRIIGSAIGALVTGFWASIGAVTVVFAVIDHYAAARFLFDWDPPAALPTIRESAQSRWNRAAQVTSQAVVLLWWIGVLKVGWPQGWNVSLTLHPASLQGDLYWPVAGLLCAGIAVDVMALVRPDLACAPGELASIATWLGGVALAGHLVCGTLGAARFAPTLKPASLWTVEPSLDGVIRVCIVAFALTMTFEAALESWRLIRRQGRTGRTPVAKLRMTP